MGSSLETAIIISSIVIFLSAFIIAPIEIMIDSYELTKESVEIINSNSDYSVEDFTTLMTGISENMRIILGG